MSFRGEMKDFLTSALAVHKSFRDDDNSAARNNYYKALIENAKNSQAIAQQRLAMQDRNARAGLGMRGRALDIQEKMRGDSINERRQYHNDLQQYRQDLLKSKNPDPYSAPGLNDLSPKAPATSGAGAVSTEPDADDVQGASPATADDDEDDNLNPNEVTGQNTAPGTSYNYNQGQDEQGQDEQAFAQGGAVGDDPRQATDDAMSNASVQAAQPEEPKATKAKSGFDLKQALDSWEKSTPKQVPRPAVSDQVRSYTSSANTAPPAAQPQGAVGDTPPVQGFGDDQPASMPRTPDLADQHAPNTGAGATGSTPPAQGFGDDQGAARGADKAPDNPVGIGLKQIISAYQLDKTPAVQDGPHPGQAAMHSAKEAATDQEVAGMDKAVDPGNELSASAKTVARLDAGVNFWLSQGNKKNAAVLSQRLLEYGKLKTQDLGQAAAKAVKDGDTQKATELLTKAYSFIPDGGTLDAQPNKDGSVTAKVTDERSGMTLDLGTMGPEQLYKYSLGVANGSEYMQHLTQIASGNIGLKKGNTPGAGAAPKVGTMRDRAAAQTMTEGVQPKEDIASPPEYSDSVKGVAQQLLRGNEMTPQEATNFSAAAINPKSPKDMFKLEPDGSATATFNGRPIKVPRDAFLQIAAIRGQQLSKQSASEATTKAKTDRAQADEDRVNKAKAPMLQRTADRQSRARQTRQDYATQDAQ